MKKIFKIVIPVLFLLTCLQVSADYTYTVLAPIGNIKGSTDLKSYLKEGFNIAITLSATFAVLMIVFGGFQYMTSDAIQGKAAGIARIKNAIFGLVLVLCAWLILSTINPDLLSFSLELN